MTTCKLRLMVFPLTALGLPLVAHAQSVTQTVPTTQRSTVAPPHGVPITADANISSAEEQLRRVEMGYRSGINTPEDMTRAQVVLAEARLRSAISRNNSEDILQNLQSLQGQQQELLKLAEAQNKAGMIVLTDVFKARAALAQARIRLDLYTLVTIREQELDGVNGRYAAGIATTQDKENAADALQKARQFFAQIGNE